MFQLTDKALRDLRPHDYIQNAKNTFDTLGWEEESKFMKMISNCYLNAEIEKIEYVIGKLKYDRPNM